MKAFLQKLILLVFGFTAMQASAQENIAPKATTSCQGSGGVTPYCWNWNRINDGVNNSCGSQEAFIWTTSPPNGSEWMQFDWTRPYLIGEIHIYHAQTTGRFLTGGTVQKWDGTKWVDHYKFSGLSQSNCDNKVTFTPFVGDKMRITDFKPGTGQNSNLNYREIEIWALSSEFDAGITALVQPANLCNYTQDITVRLQNLGLQKIDSAEVHWSLDGVSQTPVLWNKGANFNLSDTITKGAYADINLKTNHTFTEGVDVQIKAWSVMPNGKQDTVPFNDTLDYTFEFLGSPSDPGVVDVRNCGIGRVELKATPGNAKDKVLWFDERKGGNIVGEGTTILSPFLTKSDSFFAQSSKLSTNIHENGINGTYIITGNFGVENGAYWNVTPKNPIILDSVIVRMYQLYAGTTYRLYYREGGFGGYETNGSAWTLVKQGAQNPYSAPQGAMLAVEDLGLILDGNKTYGFYFTTDPSAGVGNDIWVGTGNTAYDNGEVTIQGGSCGQGLFGSVGIYTTYSQDLRIGYTNLTCNSNRIRLDVEIVPTPYGASLVKGTNYNGVFNTGKSLDPDFVAEERTAVYELTPPTLYTNGDFGTDWVISDLYMGTVNGTPIPSTDTTMSLPGANNGVLTYTPSLGWVDSTIMLQVTLYDFNVDCDSVLTRYIYIAPTPHPNFEGGDVCDGEAVELTNLTEIHSGFVNYKWDFDDGTTGDFETPIHLFPGPGTYKVKLTATSELGISKDTTIDVVVYEIPDVKFSVKNNCEGIAVEFLNKTSISTGTIDYKWDFGDGNTSNLESPKHLYSKPGGYKVNLQATANGCKNELTKNAFQFARPDASFTVDGKCSGQPVTVTNTSTIANGSFGTKWDFGSGEYGTLEADEFTFATGGMKLIKMKAISEFGCTDSAEKTVTIEQAPIADFSYGPLCDVDDVDFTNLSIEPAGIATIYEWDFGDGNTSTMKNPTHNYAQYGPVVISLKATGSNGCFTTKVVEDRVLIQPVAEFTVGDGCSGEPVQFINKSFVSAGNIEYRWDFGDEDSAFVNSPKKVYNVNESTTFFATLTASVLGGCDDQFSLPVTIGEQPTCEFTATRSTSDRTVWTFTPANTTYGEDAYIWVFEGSGLSTEVSPTHSFDYEDNEYRVILRIQTIEGCICQDSNNFVTTSWGLGVDDLSFNNGLKVYPNPTDGVVFVEIENWLGSDHGQIQVLDITGRVINATEISEAKPSVDLSGLSSGLYTIKVINNSQGSIHTTQVRLQ